MPLLIAFFLSNLKFQILFFLLPSDRSEQPDRPEPSDSFPLLPNAFIDCLLPLRSHISDSSIPISSPSTSSSDPEAGRTAEKSIAKSALSLTPSPANSYISKKFFIYFLFSAWLTFRLVVCFPLCCRMTAWPLEDERRNNPNDKYTRFLFFAPFRVHALACLLKRFFDLVIRLPFLPFTLSFWFLHFDFCFKESLWLILFFWYRDIISAISVISVSVFFAGGWLFLQSV